VETNRKTRPLSLKPFSTSRVDIIVPLHSQYERVSGLIRSIVLSVKSNPYQITLVDDCSENRSFGEEVKREFAKNTPDGYKPQVQYIRSDEHLGFAGALKLGFDSTDNPWVLFMHSDCVVEDPNFMIDMGQSLLRWKKEGVPVKMVSARSDNPCDLDAARAGRMDKGEADIVLESETLPLFCAMCNRDLFRHIGGFLKPYPYAWYEDEELAHRMRSMGLRQGISSRAWIRHHGGATVKYLWESKPESKAAMEGNRERCLKDIRSLKRETSAA
jgi:GT2 family glycosyltransferase